MGESHGAEIGEVSLASWFFVARVIVVDSRWQGWCLHGILWAVLGRANGAWYMMWRAVRTGLGVVAWRLGMCGSARWLNKEFQFRRALWLYSCAVDHLEGLLL